MACLSIFVSHWLFVIDLFCVSYGLFVIGGNPCVFVMPGGSKAVPTATSGNSSGIRRRRTVQWNLTNGVFTIKEDGIALPVQRPVVDQWSLHVCRWHVAEESRREVDGDCPGSKLRHADLAGYLGDVLRSTQNTVCFTEASMTNFVGITLSEEWSISMFTIGIQNGKPSCHSGS